MIDPSTIVDCGSASEVAAYGIGRIDQLGGMTCIAFYRPAVSGKECVNQVVLNPFVPTDQLGEIMQALAMAKEGQVSPADLTKALELVDL